MDCSHVEPVSSFVPVLRNSVSQLMNSSKCETIGHNRALFSTSGVSLPQTWIVYSHITVRFIAVCRTTSQRDSRRQKSGAAHLIVHRLIVPVEGGCHTLHRHTDFSANTDFAAVKSSLVVRSNKIDTHFIPSFVYWTYNTTMSFQITSSEYSNVPSIFPTMQIAPVERY